MRIIKKPHSTLPPAIHSECVRFTKYRKNSKPGLFECSSALRLIFCLQKYNFSANAATKPRKFILFSCCSCNPNNTWRNHSPANRRFWGASRYNFTFKSLQWRMPTQNPQNHGNSCRFAATRFASLRTKWSNPGYRLFSGLLRSSQWREATKNPYPAGFPWFP